MDTENEPLREDSDLFLKDFYKRENQLYSLPNNEQIKYSAIILLDFFSIEEFDNLFDGLDALYSEVRNECSNLNYFNPMLSYRKLDYRKIFYDKKISWLFLPPIINNGYDSGIPHSACYDLGSNIKELLLTVYQILPSTIVLQIQANLLPSVSEKINNIIYKCPEYIEIAQIEKDGLRERSLGNLKKENICGIKNEIKKQIVDFISTFFKGFFFKKSEKCISIIPCIDVYSLTYPNESKDISKWLLDNTLFFECFNIFTYNTGYRYEEYLFLENSNSEEPFNNYSILISHELGDKKRYSTFGGSIRYPLQEISFDLLCFYRWLKFTERHTRKFNEYLTKELGTFTKNELKNLIFNRHSITNELFYFERFKIEFEECKLEVFHKGYEFKFLSDPEIYLFETLLLKIKEENTNLDAMTEILNKQSINNLSLTNIMYNTEMQGKVLQLTYVVIILALIQICLSSQDLYLALTSILIFILKLFSYLLNLFFTFLYTWN